MPASVNAQVRAESELAAAGNARSKSCAAHICRFRRRERPTHAPKAQSARPWASSEPVCSSQRRAQLLKLGKRVWFGSDAQVAQAAEAGGRLWTLGVSSPGSSSRTH